jgi:hypothetical protein
MIAHLLLSRALLTQQSSSLYLIPGSRAPLERVCLGGDNLMLAYSDQRTRLWDVKTREFWRSMGTEKAKELLQQGGWDEAWVTTALWIVGDAHNRAICPGLPMAAIVC